MSNEVNNGYLLCPASHNSAPRLSLWVVLVSGTQGVLGLGYFVNGDTFCGLTYVQDTFFIGALGNHCHLTFLLSKIPVFCLLLLYDYSALIHVFSSQANVIRKTTVLDVMRRLLQARHSIG